MIRSSALVSHALVVCAAFSLVACTGSVLAQPFTYSHFPSNTVINTPVTADFAIVGYSGGMYNEVDFTREFTGPSSPTIQVVAGADIPDAEVFNHSTVHVTGGSVTFAAMYDTSTLRVSGGTVGFSLGFDSSEIHVTGGTVTELAGQGRLANVSGGMLGIVTANSNTDTMGGQLGSCIVNLTGGTFMEEVNALNEGILNLYGGQILAPFLRSAEGGTLNIYGTGLSAQLTNPNAPNGYSLYTLAGLLSDGSSLDGVQLRVRNDGVTYGHSTFNLITVPAPSAAATVALGGLMAARRRRGR